MEHIFIYGENFRHAHAYAERLGFKRGQYKAITNRDQTRGMKDATMFILPRAELHPDYIQIYNEAQFRNFTIIFIDDETLDIIEGVAYTEASPH